MSVYLNDIYLCHEKPRQRVAGAFHVLQYLNTMFFELLDRTSGRQVATGLV